MQSERYERIMAAVRLEVPDRIPWALWGHFPALPFLEYYSWEKANRDGEETARAHIALLNELDYKMDLLKVTPFYGYMACKWGSKFPFKNNDESVDWSLVDVVVKKTDDWQKLWVLNPRRELRENLRTVSILSREIGRGMPFIYTIPSPIIQALYDVSTADRVHADMKSSPDSLKQGLETITQTCIDFGKACIEEGATGIYLGSGGGEVFWSRMNPTQLEEYALHYDNKILNALRDAPIRLLHICGDEQANAEKNGGLMESGWFRQYSVNAINWWSTSHTQIPSAKRVYGGSFCLVAGVDHKRTMRYGTPQEVENEVKASIEAAGDGRGFILGPGCTLFQDTPLANFNAVARSVEKYGRLKR